MSQVTTHILDTTKGTPAAGVAVVLFTKNGQLWQVIATGITNTDGRIPNLLSSDIPLPFGEYKLNFDTGPYFAAQNIEAFYPTVDIVFEIKTTAHYHVPLLLSPFGYSTYRGS
jgi:5-hydroxyisourate hydrolase